MDGLGWAEREREGERERERDKVTKISDVRAPVL